MDLITPSLFVMYRAALHALQVILVKWALIYSGKLFCTGYNNLIQGDKNATQTLDVQAASGIFSS